MTSSPLLPAPFICCSSQVSRLLRRVEVGSAGLSDRETPPALHLLPHQLPAETEPEWQLWDADRILCETFPDILSQCFICNHFTAFYADNSYWTLTDNIFSPSDAVAAHPEQRPPADWSVLSAHRLGTTASQLFTAHSRGIRIQNIILNYATVTFCMSILTSSWKNWTQTNKLSHSVC